MDETTARTRATPGQMRSRIGTGFGASDWILVDQSMVDAFARLTFDEYFIHVDPARARRETPHGGTIVHGLLTLSLLSQMSYQVCPLVEGTKSGLNYGFNRLRFVAPVPTGSRLRGHFGLAEFEYEPDRRWKAAWDVTIEIEGAPKPALVAQWLNVGLL